MSKIEKLSILGVRSFGTLDTETITFNTPLTLIVGYNGSGKTTVIECLKYATTGQLPPNSKNGAFIHDPDLCGEKDVRAQVKLVFRSTIGEEFVMTRNMQLLVKPKKREFKTLEGSLLLKKSGERTHLSNKVSELDALIPYKLGVSAAVLESVIFCHQDESLWPMSEPSALKKKFDEIFEALKYTKVIDNLKVLRTRKVAELRNLYEAEARAKRDKDRADVVYGIMTKLTKQIEEGRDQCNNLLKQMDEESDKIKEKQMQAQSFYTIMSDLQMKTERLGYKKEAILELQSRIEELPDSDEVLNGILDEYERSTERTVADRDRKTAQLRELQAELKSTRAEHTQKAAEQGKHQSDKEKYDRQLVDRSQMIQDAAGRHEIRGYDDELDDERIADFYDRIQRMLNEKKRELERLQRDNSADLDQKQGVITDLEAKKSSLQKDRTAAMQRMAAIGRDMATLQGELSSLNVDEGVEAVLKMEMQELESKIETAKQEEQATDFDSQIRAVNEEIWKLEAQAAKLNRELVECTRLASERAQLDLRKKQIADRRRDLEVLRNTWNEKLSAAVGQNWEPQTVEAEFQIAIKRQNTLVAQLRKEKDTAQQELKQVEYKLSAARDKQSKLSAEGKQCQQAVVKALQDVKADDLSIDSYEAEVARADKDLGENQVDLELFEHMKKFYAKAEEQATNQNKCTLCTRSFGTDEASKTKFFERIKKRVDEKEKVAYIRAVADAKKDLLILRGVRKQYDTYRRLDAELPSLNKEITELTGQKEGLVHRLEDHDLVYREAEEKQQEVEALGKHVLKIAQTHKDIVDSERQVERSQQSSSTVLRSPDEINDEQNTCTEQTRVAQTKLAKLTTDKQRLKDAISQLEVERHEVRHKISQAALEVERKKTLVEAIRRHKEEQSQLRESYQAVGKEIEAMEPEIVGARTALEEARRQGREKEKKLADERDAVANTANELKKANAEIQSYLDRGGPSNLAANQRAIALLEGTISRLESEMKALTEQITKLNRELDYSDARKRNISDNLSYRKNKRESEALQREIEQLQARNAHEDYDRLINEAKYHESKRGRFGAERERLMGMMAQKDEEFKERMDEYEINLKDAGAKFKEARIRVETTKAAVDDLARGQQALDQAIIRFHSLKMEEINRSIADLWQSTYQGTDIDTIQIRADAEPVKETSSTATVRKSYNYRVIMVKGDTEMDMRGRCSAGQKVLASIIIRLALAESFGVNCGLIALDEPTTNLDSDNIRSLAESLHGIIKARLAQKNLQLIIITHDEEFLKHMQCSDFCDDFYRVRRDERQNSIITRESITRISE